MPLTPTHTPLTLEFADLSTDPASGTIRAASWADVEPTLTRYLAEPGDTGAFLILGPTDTTYIQSTTCDGGFVVEHQAGSTDHHFELPPPSNAAAVAALFRAYFDNPANAANLADWEPLELP